VDDETRVTDGDSAAHDAATSRLDSALDFALRYASSGYRVLPLRPRSKVPLTERGAHDASCDESRIRSWWERWPNANVGLALQNLIAVDIDPRNGGDVDALPERLPDTCYAKTGGGGWHYLYSALAEARVRAHPTPGVDVKTGAGQYLVVEPSVHPSGEKYVWLDETEPWASKPAVAPDWLYEPEPKSRGTPVQAIKMIRDGARNNTLTSLAGSMRTKGFSENSMLTALLEHNREFCAPPLPEAEVQGIAASVARYQPSPSRRPADRLVDLALELFEFKRTSADEPFALRRNGPNIAVILRGSRDEMRATLAREYHARYSTTPTSSAMADALTVLHGHALEAERVSVHLRVAFHQNGIVLDLGRDDGHVVCVDAEGWRVLEHSPMLFRRTALTGELPLPELGGTLDELRQFLRGTDATWPLLLGWLTAAFFPTIPHPVLLVGGEQDSGKTSAARTIASLVDPSPALVRAQPRDLQEWAVAAAASWVIATDNVSGIPLWWSDALCRAVTGEGLLRRRLYTDSDVTVLSFKRAVILTSIDAGALRDDLGDRILLADFEPIAPGARLEQSVFEHRLLSARPRILGALLDLVTAVLRELPQVQLRELPRLADFARMLGAMDRAIGTNALRHYLSQRGRVAADVVEGDLVAAAIAKLGPWAGKMGELYDRLTPERRPHGWPSSPRGLGARLRRVIPALRQIGVHVKIGQRTREGIPVEVTVDE
jgi:Bifunctional DNA primase/polymerase, N-terminal/Primase C terminal 1 (PriCT-1)